MNWRDEQRAALSKALQECSEAMRAATIYYNESAARMEAELERRLNAMPPEAQAAMRDYLKRSRL